MTNSTKDQSKGKSKGKDPKAIDSKPKENKNNSEGALGSKKKKKFENKMCPYCMRGFHPEKYCMKKQVDELIDLLKKNNISLPQREKKSDDGQSTYDHERFPTLKYGLP